MWKALVLVCALCSAVGAQPALPDRTERVVAAAKLCARTKFLHPYLAYKDIDWDAALVTALPKLERAATLDQYRAALAGMLAELHDPVTRIATPAPPAAQGSAGQGTVITWPTPAILQVDL